MVLQKSFEVLLSILAKEEAVDPRAKLLKGEVRGSEKSPSNVVGGVVDGFKKTGLRKAELEGAKLAGEELDDFGGFWWWNEKAVNAVDDTIGTELELLASFSYLERDEKTYNVDGHNAAVEVDCQAFETDVCAQALWADAQRIWQLEQCWDGMGNKDSTSWVKFW